MTDSPSTPLPPLDAEAMADALWANRRESVWDEKTVAQIVGKIRRGTSTIPPLDSKVATEIVAETVLGWGCHQAVRRAKVTYRTFYAWVAKSYTNDPDAAPYRALRDELNATFEQLRASRGLPDRVWL